MVKIKNLVISSEYYNQLIIELIQKYIIDRNLNVKIRIIMRHITTQNEQIILSNNLTNNTKNQNFNLSQKTYYVIKSSDANQLIDVLKLNSKDKWTKIIIKIPDCKLSFRVRSINIESNYETMDIINSIITIFVPYIKYMAKK
ncbi:hypothetical protein [Acanthamoeba polyphaga mimivirus]|uniref:Uncharacterized protein n=2 Tax=Megamimivirinae TaxID=3044648 RepID=A0A2L2DIA7_MIMIV|nr:hypothetical protein MegaChil _gp0168 [Megavirus chiliensis]AEQ33196.1 hypothetical protein [Megavirus chiliensis]AVG45902.1 hypothetical protein [Acanthamoeba polyphaga mimivirus]AVG47005.1 hypothetical protein [Acanthamoeba polyphaga mimivirus]